ncbi:TIGR04255 family protein (plasmid) [Cupriavidus necator]|nr:TIGR04255 family protein [Cupriavidus necator]
MKERTLHVVEAASQVIDSDFFTRVGLRYINVVTSDTEDPVDEWVNPELTAPLLSQRFQGVQDYSGKLQLAAADGGCLLQHGIRLKTLPPTTGEAGKTVPSYYIDVDAYRTEVLIKDASAALDAMHKQAFEMFDWAIGDKAREYLSAERTSAKR